MIDVCHVQVLPILSGVQRAMLEMFRHLDRDRYRPHVVCQQPGPLSEELERLEIACHFVPALIRPIRPWSDLAALTALTDLFRHFRFDVVHTHSSKPGIVGRVAARRAGVPLVIHHVHAFAFHAFTPSPQRFVYSRLERWAGRYCDRVIFVNHEERELAVREGLLPADKCRTVHNGVDLAPYQHDEHTRCRDRFRQQHGIDDDETAIVFCGRIDVPKQPLLLPQIVSRLEQLRPNDKWRLFIAGGGPMEPELNAAIEQSGLQRRIVTLGWQDETHHAFHGGDVCLQPSLWEGLPLSVVEAHAAGLPVVGSDVKGIREVVTAETGVLCEPRNAAAFATSLATLIDEPFLRRRLGAAARKRAHEHFDGQRNFRQIGELYDQWLGNEPQKLRQAG
jgi:glycosyltransferase involved in cell wall biosynthesis